ncbi:MAG: DEAD/DEAH box helicase [Bacteroides sp.]|nr:DEAD/DEAH box helicase [Roseburia sp.]MCM1347626.1 DEAD/DEAH box helicase [Bacteroides sp.]MCM1422076.1 DEAD/DEAH box helicase [Bacteroides sp.]
MNTLRDYQSDIVSRIHTEWKRHKSVMVQMPTGTGKTHVLAAVVRDFLQAESKSCVWLIAHRKELVAQIEETVERYGIRKEDKTVKAMSIQWLARHWDNTGECPGLIVIDEAHHTLAESYKELWRRYPEARKLGMTATPCRLNRRGFTDLFNVLVTSWSIAQFIAKGQLSLFDYISINSGSKEQLLVESLQKRGSDGDFQVKEMNEVLNKKTAISRLYKSMEQYAHGKKGIVYAISIDHARTIAEYYNERGIRTVAIDSKTPDAERKAKVEQFKQGDIQVLVNVDVFSEGFDCPDVEFVQMARPTLSLSKYLQQAGRGLRKADGKETCVLIDNVGLYRIFGLPTMEWDWDALFHGKESGKGEMPYRCERATQQTTAHSDEDTTEAPDMEIIVSHDRLPELLEKQERMPEKRPQRDTELKVWQEKENGLWGLRAGRRQTTEACFPRIFDTRYNMAAVEFCDHTCGLTNADGTELWKRKKCKNMRFASNHLLAVTSPDDKVSYLDLHSLHTYDKKPEIKRFGNIELLKTGQTCHSRTKNVYTYRLSMNNDYIHKENFYLAIFDNKMPQSAYANNAAQHGYSNYACLLSNDHDDYYWICQWLSDGSIIVMNNQRQYFHARQGERKKYIGCDSSEKGNADCLKEISRLMEQAKQLRKAKLAEQATRRQQILNEFRCAVPFKAGMKWGLKIGERVTVPPIYRNVRPPVGRFCAVERNYSQWGIIAVDGKIMVEPKYQEVAIEENGTAILTFVTGKKTSVKLQ